MAVFDINQIYQAQFGTVGEPLPTGGAAPSAGNGAIIRCPLTLSADGASYTLPFEPLVSVTGKNVITKNYVLKNKEIGTIKEYWNADDYRIEIKGVVIGESNERLPSEDLNMIRKFCELRKAIEVSSPYLTIFGIQFMAIEDYDFPHTAGYANQAYVIRGYSDKPFELF